MTMAKKSASRSRRSCSVSLYKIAPKPRKAPALGTGRLDLRLTLGGQLDKDVFKIRSQWADLVDLDVAARQFGYQFLLVERLDDQRMDRFTENGGTANRLRAAHHVQRPRYFRRPDF